MPYKDLKKQREYQLNWITANRKKYIQQMGCCMFCGSLDDIEIHHTDPDSKESHRIWSWSDDRIENELRKCVALCHHCHELFHALSKRKAVKHGSTTAYRYGCRCPDCRGANAERNRHQKMARKERESKAMLEAMGQTTMAIR